MRIEIERKQRTLQKLSKVCRGIEVFVLCCTLNYIFGSSFSHILPTAISAAFIIGGTQYMFYSLYMTYGRKQNRINNDR